MSAAKKRKNVPSGNRPVALVTGASAGIGESFARKLAAREYDLVLVARRADRLDSLAEDLRIESGAQSLVLAADLGKAASPRHVFDQVNQAGLRVELLVNNAGFGTFGVFHEMPPERELEMVDLNIRSLVEMTRLFVPRMVERRSGAILNLGSVGSFLSCPYMATYAATKAFVLSFTEALNAELSEHGVLAMCVCPGGTRTEFQQVARFDASGLDSAFMSADEVVDIALRDLDARRVLSVSGWMNKLAVGLVSLLPRRVLTPAVKMLAGKRVGSSASS